VRDPASTAAASFADSVAKGVDSFKLAAARIVRRVVSNHEGKANDFGVSWHRSHLPCSKPELQGAHARVAYRVILSALSLSLVPNQRHGLWDE